MNIDAPEKKQPFGRWSMNQLKSLVANTPVTVTYTQTDRYGRILGRVYTEDGMEVNRWLVQHGAARYILISTQITPCRHTRERPEQ